jgi:hypothetical protein
MSAHQPSTVYYQSAPQHQPPAPPRDVVYQEQYQQQRGPCGDAFARCWAVIVACFVSCWEAITMCFTGCIRNCAECCAHCCGQRGPYYGDQVVVQQQPVYAPGFSGPPGKEPHVVGA